MSVLTMIQDHCRIHALAVPSSVVASADMGVQQLYAILGEVLDEMVNESSFNVITREALFTSIPSEDQGSLDTLAPYGCQFPYFETFFDRTLRRPLYGPLNETQWQEIKAIPNPGPFYKFRIRENHLLLAPAPTTPFSQIAFEYASSWCVTDSAGTPKARMTEDSDLFLFPDRIIRRGLAYRWKQIKGLPYESDESQYYNLLTNYIARDKVKTRINISEPNQPDIRPGIFVPSGNWMH